MTNYNIESRKKLSFATLASLRLCVEITLPKIHKGGEKYTSTL
jgi:hypothetical protein